MTDEARLLVRLEASTASIEKQMKRVSRLSGNAANSIDRRFVRANKRLRTSMSQGESTFKRYQFGIQNAAFQVGDFAVQVAGGQSAVRAFSQQAPQFLGAFGAIGAIIGAGTAVLAPFIGNLISAGEEMEKINAISLEGVNSRLSELKRLQEEYNATVAVSGVVRSEATQQSLDALAREYDARVSLLELERVTLQQRRKQLEDGLEASKARIEQIKAEQSIFLDQADPTGGFARSQRSSEQLEAVKELVAANEDVFLEIQRQNAELELVKLSIEEIDRFTKDAANSTEELGNKMSLAERMAQAIARADIAGGIAAATDEASRLAAELARAVSIFGDIGAPTGPDAAVNAVREKFKPPASITKTYRGRGTRGRGSRGGGGRGGGGSRSGRSADDILDLGRQEILQLERQIALYGQSDAAIAKTTAKYKLLDAAKKANLDLDARSAETGQTLRDRIDEQAAAIGRLTEKAEKYREQAAFMDEINQDLKDGFLDAIVEGENFGDVLESLAKKLAKASLEAAIFGTGPLAGGGGGGLLSGLFSGLFGGKGLLSFDGGGYTGSGPRSGGVDGKGGFPALLHPNERVVDLTRGGGGNANVTIGLTVDDDGGLQAYVKRVSGAQVAGGIRMAAQEQRKAFGTQAQEFDRRGTV